MTTKLLVVSATSVVTMVLISICSSKEDATIEKMVNNGANPVEAACAIRPSRMRVELCLAYKLTKQKSTDNE